MIALPLLLLPLLIWANSPHLWVAYAFAYLYWWRSCSRWVRRP